MSEREIKRKDLDFINFNSLQKVVNISVDHRPINIFNLMKKHGFRHYVKVLEPSIENAHFSMLGKETGKISQTRPSKDYYFYFAYNEAGQLALYNAETNELKEAFSVISLLDVAFYQYEQEKEDLLTFIKKQIKRNIETSLNLFSDSLTIQKEEDKKQLKPFLSKLNKLLEEATEQTINTFIYFSNSFILLETFYLRATIQEKDYTLKEYLNYLIKNLEAQQTTQTLLQNTLREQLANFLTNLNLSEEELIEQYTTPAQALIKKMYSNIASEQDSFNIELARLTALENAKKLIGKDYFILNYFKYNNIILQSNLLESNLLEARQLLSDLESGKLANINNLYNFIFTTEQTEKAEIEALTENDIMYRTANNIMHGILTIARIDSQKVISATDLELYINKDQLSKEEQQKLSNRLRNSDKDFIEHIIIYNNAKKDKSFKENELREAQNELRKLKEKGGNIEDIAYLSQKIEDLKAELKQLRENIKPLSKNIIPYNNDYYKNKATNGKDTYINEEKSGKIEITNADNSLSFFEETETCIKQKNLTFDIFLSVCEIVGRTGNNKVFFSLSDIYAYMQGKGELQPNDTRANKEQAVIKFYNNCYLLQGLTIEHCILKQGKQRKEYKDIGKDPIFTQARYKAYEGVYITLNESLANINRRNNGFVILPHEIRNLRAESTLLLYGLRENNKLHKTKNPLNKIKAGLLAQYLGLGDTHYKGKNKSRVVEGLNKAILTAEEIDKIIKLKSPLATNLNDNLIIEDLMKTKAYEEARLKDSRKKTNPKKH